MIFNPPTSLASRFDNDRLLAIGVALAFLAVGALAGLVTATGQPIPIALVVGGAAGVLLLSFPGVAVWIVLIGVLAITGQLFMHYPALIKLGWLFSLLGFFLTGMAMLYPALGREHPPLRPPAFVPLMALFMVWGLATMLFPEGSFAEAYTGVKRYFQYFGLMFILAVYPFRVKTVRAWLVFLGIVQLMHLGFVLYQRFVLVPRYEALVGTIEGMIPMDMVVGTFEGTLGAGGASSTMAMMCLAAIAFVLALWRERLIAVPAALLGLLIALLPLGLGETNVVIVWFPVAMAALYLDVLRRNPAGFALGGIVVLLLVAAFVYLYAVFSTSDGRGLTFAERLSETLAYNFGRKGYYGGGSVNRMTAIPFWFEQHGLADPIGTMFGHGIGSSYGGGGRVELTGHMHDAFRGRAIGLTSFSTILWDLGVVGFMLYCAAFASAALGAMKLALDAAPGFDRAFCRALFAMMAMHLVLPMYSDLSLQTPSQEVLQSLTMGLIAWRWRRGEPIGTPAVSDQAPMAQARREARRAARRGAARVTGVRP